MPFPILARKVKKLASQQLLQIKQLLAGRGFAKFKRLYRIKGELGQGGFGIVYRGVRLADGCPVAVKFIERRHVREWGRLEDQRVPMEICMLARCCRVPGVIGLLDWFSLPEGFLLVMERPSPCIDLFDFIHQQKCLDESLARFLFGQIVRAVADCAERRVLHRDLKDENVLLELTSGRVRLIDFGAATLMNRQRFTDFQGTRLYCPPEWFLHSLYLGKEAAVWSLGVLLYNMLNGRLPFLNEKDICTAHLLGPLPFFAPLSREVRDLLNQCLNFDPFARPSLEQILSNPWLTNHNKPANPEWTHLIASCTFEDNNGGATNEEEERQEREEYDEEELELAEQRQRHESGLASECCYSASQNNSLTTTNKGPQKKKQMPTASQVPAEKNQCPVRRNARTAHLGWQDEADKKKKQQKQQQQEETAASAAYSIVRQSLCQFGLLYSAGKQQQQMMGAAGSVDSGTASALHSPRNALPAENAFPQFY